MCSEVFRAATPWFAVWGAAGVGGIQHLALIWCISWWGIWVKSHFKRETDLVMNISRTYVYCLRTLEVMLTYVNMLLSLIYNMKCWLSSIPTHDVCCTLCLITKLLLELMVEEAPQQTTVLAVHVWWHIHNLIQYGTSNRILLNYTVTYFGILKVNVNGQVNWWTCSQLYFCNNNIHFLGLCISP